MKNDNVIEVKSIYADDKEILKILMNNIKTIRGEQL